MKKPI